MRIVVDASTVVAALIDAGEEGTWATSLLTQDLVAPSLVQVEATNILRRLGLAGMLEDLESSEAVRDLLDMKIETVPFEPFASRVWELRRNLTSYDAWYVAVAEEADLPLATLDRRLARASGPRCEFLLRQD